MVHKKPEIEESKNVANATKHLIWIFLVALGIVFLINELFQNSNLGRILTITIILSYIIFSFAERYWTNQKTKIILTTIDSMATMCIGLFLIIMSYRCVYCDSVGFASGTTIINAIPQPHIVIFYLGVILSIVAILRVYLTNHYMKAELKKF